MLPPQRLFAALACALAVLPLAACQDRRDLLMQTRYPGYPADIRHAIDRGYVVRGMDAEQVYLALGEPMCRKTIAYQGRPVDVWVYPPGGRDPCQTGEYRVYFEHGLVTRWDRFDQPTRFTSPPGGEPP